MRDQSRLRILWLCVAILAWGAPYARGQENLAKARERYEKQRRSLANVDQTMRFDAAARASLTDEEKKANEILIALRDREIDDYQNNNSCPPGHPFYKSRETIEKSKMFAILRQMPKGAALHVHSSSAGNVASILKACSRPECIVELQDDGQGGRRLTGVFRFIEPDSPLPSNYEYASTARKALGEQEFAKQITEQLTLDATEEGAPDVWKKFDACFPRIDSALDYEPVFEEYFLDAFRVLAADHVDYVELRT